MDDPYITAGAAIAALASYASGVEDGRSSGDLGPLLSALAVARAVLAVADTLRTQNLSVIAYTMTP